GDDSSSSEPDDEESESTVTRSTGGPGSPSQSGGYGGSRWSHHGDHGHQNRPAHQGTPGGPGQRHRVVRPIERGSSGEEPITQPDDAPRRHGDAAAGADAAPNGDLPAREPADTSGATRDHTPGEPSREPASTSGATPPGATPPGDAVGETAERGTAAEPTGSADRETSAPGGATPPADDTPGELAAASTGAARDGEAHANEGAPRGEGGTSAAHAGQAPSATGVELPPEEQTASSRFPFGRPGRPFRQSPFLFGLTGALGVAVAWGLVQALISVRGVLVLLVVALFLAVGLNPAVEFLQRHRVPRVWAVTIVFLGLLIFVAGFVSAIVPPLVQQGNA